MPACRIQCDTGMMTLKTGPNAETTFLTQVAHDGCILPTLNLYRYRKPVTTGDLARLTQVSLPTARRTLDAMVKHDLARVTRRKRGPLHVARITLTPRGQRLGELLHAADHATTPRTTKT
jgi:DNA-binding HxlR family transcriptional regulator